MSDEHDGGAAFPRPFSMDTFNDEVVHSQSGMSLRDYFAGEAMKAIYMRLGGSPVETDASSMGYTAKWAYAQADAMLKARSA